MLQMALTNRFKKRSLDPDPPFLSAEASDSAVSISPLEGVAVVASAAENGVLTAFSQVGHQGRGRGGGGGDDSHV